MFLQRFPTRQGGAERQVEALVPLLAERGVEVSVIARREGSLVASDMDDVDLQHVSARGGRVGSALTYVAGAVRRVQEQRPDVLHAHGLLSPSSAAVLAGRVTGVPVVTKVLLGGANGEVERVRAWRRGGAPRLQALVRTVDRFVVISDEIDRELAEAGVPPARRVFIPNGVDTTRFRPADDSVRAHSRAGLGIPDGPVVLYVGRLNPQKGLDVLLRSWRGVRGRFPDARLLVAGEGALREMVAQAADEGVTLLGQVDDVERYHHAADVFVLPSYAEGLSNALLEAMASGLPIVATDVGATNEVLAGSGRVVSAGDATALESTLVELLGDPSTRAELSDRARLRVKDGYRLADTADRLVELYRSVARRV
jgi:glycosyltransferase involved in cell wall biosynthesis